MEFNKARMEKKITCGELSHFDLEKMYPTFGLTPTDQNPLRHLK